MPPARHDSRDLAALAPNFRHYIGPLAAPLTPTQAKRHSLRRLPCGFIANGLARPANDHGVPGTSAVPNAPEGGGGPAQLALAIRADFYRRNGYEPREADERALQFHQPFKNAWVAALDQNAGWRIEEGPLAAIMLTVEQRSLRRS
jgi:hypothetical protein